MDCSCQRQSSHEIGYNMGNIMDRKVSCAEPLVTSAPATHLFSLPLKESENKVVAEKVEEKPELQPAQITPSLTYQLYNYRQQMGCKNHHMMKWATSKLLLTEELLKLHRQTTSESWTDDEEDVENNVPQRDNNDNDDLLAQELYNLKNYRQTLRDAILEVAREKMKRREKKKLKRLKRRTLISSKKPSKKDKLKLWHEQTPSMPLLDDEEEEEDLPREHKTQPIIIIID